MNSSTKYTHEIETDGNDITDGLKVENIEKLEEQNYLIIIVSELNEDKSITLLCVLKNMNKS